MPTPLRTLVVPLGLAILAIIADAAASARAEIHLAAEPEAVRLEAKDATVDEALTALTACGLQYRSAVALDRRVTGTYQGPLGRVVSRLLQGYNFVVRTSPEGVQATVLQDSSAMAVPGPTISRAGLVEPAVQEDPTIAGLRRLAPKLLQNSSGPRRIGAPRSPDAARKQ
jgi:hypothetical protein